MRVDSHSPQFWSVDRVVQRGPIIDGDDPLDAYEKKLRAERLVNNTLQGLTAMKAHGWKDLKSAKQYFDYSHQGGLSGETRSILYGTGDVEGDIGAIVALQSATVKALKTATSYSWSGHTVLAVAHASQSLPPDVTMSEFLIGGGESLTGWWFFTHTLRVKTPPEENTPNVAKAAAERTVALLWSRQRDEIWFSTFVEEENVPIPTLAWVWEDGDTIEQMTTKAIKHLGAVIPGQGAMPFGVAIATVEFFSRFFASGMTWLRQKIVVADDAPLRRQQRRRLQRESKPGEIPLVRVIELRRRESKSSSGTGEAPAWSHRWVVDGHWRNQWYKSQGVHAPKYIQSYVKGPVDLPFIERNKVYSVTR